MDAHEPIAQDLRRRGLTSDAPLIDALARAWVERWPALAAHEAGALALVVSLRDWWLRDPDHAALMVRDLEIEAIVAGDRAACLKEGIPATEANALADAYRAIGLAATIAHRHGFETGTDRHSEGQSRAVVAVARDEAALRDVVATLAAHATTERGAAVLRMADLLGYPRCCAEAFASSGEHADNIALERSVFERAPEAILHPLLQRLGRCRLLSHFPCRADCPASIALAARAFERLASIEPGLAAFLRGELERTVLFRDYDHRAIVELEDRSDGPWITRLEPLGDWPELAATQGPLRQIAPAEAFLARPGKHYIKNNISIESSSSADRSRRFQQLFPHVSGDPVVRSIEAQDRRVVVIIEGPGAVEAIAHLELDPAGRTFARVGRIGISYPSGQAASQADVIAAVRGLVRRLERSRETDASALFVD